MSLGRQSPWRRWGQTHRMPRRGHWDRERAGQDRVLFAQTHVGDEPW